jgi:hypothetical protein
MTWVQGRCPALGELLQKLAQKLSVEILQNPLG